MIILKQQEISLWRNGFIHRGSGRIPGNPYLVEHVILHEKFIGEKS